jgi:SAM-dependent methyltransferase
MKPSTLLPLLSVPGTDSDVNLVTTRVGSDQEPCDGWLEDSDGRIVAMLDNFRFDFQRLRHIDEAERRTAIEIGPQMAMKPQCTSIEPNDSALYYSGDWFNLGNGDYLKGCQGDNTNCSVSMVTECSRIEIVFHSHAWSGFAQIMVNRILHSCVDLFCESVSLPYKVTIDNPSCQTLNIVISPTGRANPLARGRQLIIEGVRFLKTDHLVLAHYQAPKFTNRGGQFRPRLMTLIEEQESYLGRPPILLDVGGGKRSLGLTNYINLEYSPYSEPTLLGDGQLLPFKTGCIDLVYSAAVLEHVRAPHLVGREIHRVLRSGGKGLINSAFMQPVHSEGQHFFNLTQWGMKEVLSSFDEVEVSWEGAMSDTLIWMLNVSGAAAKAPPEEVAAFKTIVKSFDQYITYDRLMYVASGVWGEVRKN